jgi:glycine/D-amino acid oxidase-like deaminating enzyme
MALTQSNYWLTTATMPAATAGAIPNSADVAVLGAGFTGLSAARTLAKRGAKAVVLESNSIGWGASSRNGGMVLTGLKLSPQTLAKRYGMGLTRQMYATSLASIDFVEQVIREESIDCDFSRGGHLEVASKQSHFASYARSVELIAKEFQHELRIIPRTQLKDEIGSSIYFGGIVDETSAGVNPARYVGGLATAALRAGAMVFENAGVQQIERTTRGADAGFAVRTGHSSIFVREVLVATSGYTTAVTRALQRKIIPVGSFIITTGRLGDSVARELSPRNRMIFDSKHYLHYYRLTPDNRMLFGGRAAFFPETRNTIGRSAEILRRDMVQVFPQLRDTPIEHAWGGTLDFCFDTMPHAGVADDIHFALGYAGHGVAMATYLGAKMAERICGSREEIPYATIPFPGAPLGMYNGRPWFLPFAGAYYKVLDWIS